MANFSNEYSLRHVQHDNGVTLKFECGHVWTCACLHVCMCACVHVFMCARVSKRVCVPARARAYYSILLNKKEMSLGSKTASHFIEN